MEGPQRDAGTPESPARRSLFTAVFAAAAAAIAAALGGTAVPFLLAPLRRRGTVQRADLGPLAPLREAVTAVGPREVVVTHRVVDGYMTRKAAERVAVVSDPSAPSGIAVLSTSCTHLGCGVTWNAGRGAFLCPCHGGVYGPDGKVLAGPPPHPLPRLPFTVEGGRVRLDLGGEETA